MKHKLPTAKIQQGKKTVTVSMLGFFPNRPGLKNSGYIVALDQEGVDKEHPMIRSDETGQLLCISETLLPMGQRVTLHKESRLMKDKPLVYDERAKSAEFTW